MPWQDQIVASSVNPKQPLRIGIVVGEASGDLLAADLLRHLRARGISFTAEGIAGPLMEREGCAPLFPMERLSVMGILEVLKQLPQLLRLRRQIARHFIANSPDVFIGVDSPDFNLDLEKRLKRNGIPTVHYVSPSVWAWRSWRLRKIAKSVDLMLTLFPFEQTFYQARHIPVAYVGHPFADEIPLVTDQRAARRCLGLPESGRIIALLPGSRSNEIAYLGRTFLETAQCCHQKDPTLVFVAAMVNVARQKEFAALKASIAPELPVHLVQSQSRQVIAAADVVLLASGTATLETMLLKRPMVVAYRMGRLSYWVARALVRIQYIALPNLLAGEALVPEFIQERATPQNCARALLDYLEDPEAVYNLQRVFSVLHQKLRCNAGERAVDGVLGCIAVHDRRVPSV